MCVIVKWIITGLVRACALEYGKDYNGLYDIVLDYSLKFIMLHFLSGLKDYIFRIFDWMLYSLEILL